MRVTENVPQIVAFIEGIIRNGHAYTTSQGQFSFCVASLADMFQSTNMVEHIYIYAVWHNVITLALLLRQREV